ncbi:MAG: hypothetical protein VX223_16525 [Myxococcota bacterium]|nr:hypothetical protein [Myxococcota bacterium]
MTCPKRTHWGFLALIMSLTIGTGCAKDDQATSDLGVILSTAQSVMTAATQGENKLTALANAKRLLDQKYAELTASVERLKAMKSYQLSEDTLKAMRSSLVDAGETISRLRVVLAAEMARSAEIDEAVEHIIRKFTSAITTP